MKLFNTLLILLLSTCLMAQDFNPAKISNRLQRQLQTTEDYHHVSILLNDRVDIQSLEQSFYDQKASLDERAFLLITSLKEKAASTQQNILSVLYQSNDVDRASINTYWITNLIFVKAKKSVIAQISHREDVDWMDINAKLELTNYENIELSSSIEPGSTEPGLLAINAPAMWALGYTGYGMVTFVNDTGVDPDHPSFRLKYKGHHVDPELAWYEYNSSNTTPFDCGNHGTHVLGTMVGLDRNTDDTIGVAFNAQWVGSPILCGIGTEDNVAAFQWALDPDGNPGTIDDMPDAINNSWYDPSLDTLDCISIYVPILEALEASGIAVVFSAGNEGPGSGTITPPHNINLTLVNCFTIGALDGNSPTLEIANFSSNGPSQCGGTGSLLIKPEVSAPGVNVRSAALNEGYSLKSGTSMASPHVVGAILLLKEAFPTLTGTELKTALYNTCTDLGTPGEDNIFGMGIIDVFEAYNYLINQGNIPANPHVTHDVMIYDAAAPTFICEGTVNGLNIKVENAGTVDLTSFKILYDISGTANSSGEFNWDGYLAPGERTEIEIPELNIGSGAYLLSIQLSQPNGTTDERPLNNNFRTKLISYEQINLNPEVEQVSNDMICEGAAALIRTDFSGDGTVEWYDNTSDGNLLGAGNEFFIDQLNETTTYFADIRFEKSTGFIEPDQNNLEHNEDIGGGILFDCHSPFVLKSVTIHPTSIGVVLVNLKRSSGTGLASKLHVVTEIEEQVIELGFNVPAATDLILGMNAGVSPTQISEGVNYPYNVNGILTIKSSTDTLNPLDNYYYFYDWEIEYYQNCERTPVVVEVAPDAMAPDAAFDTSADSLDLDDSGLVIFTNNSTDAVQWHWNFGDGTSSDLENPEHIYTESGVYVASLTVLNADGCSDTAIKTIVVNETITDIEKPDPSNDQIVVFPVPTKQFLNIHFDLNASQLIKIRIFDVLGREVLTFDKALFYNEMITINLSDLDNGIFFILFESNDQRIIKKVVKSKG